MIQRALLAEVVLAPRAHRVNEFLVAEAAFVRQIVVLGDDILVLIRGRVIAGLEHLVHLPAVLVVRAVMHKFASVAEAAVTGLFIVLKIEKIYVSKKVGT